MQKKIIALAIAGLASTAAFAQTNVTIYGIADAGIVYANNDNGRDAFQVVSGVLAGSRLGFKGTEDLGNGIKAVFTLEQGFNIDNGTTIDSGTGGTGAFQRQAFVGLSTKAGDVTLGRQYAPGYMASCGYDAIACSITSGQQILSNAGGFTIAGNSAARWNNTLNYKSPNFGGFEGQLIYRFGEQINNIDRAEGFGVGLKYAGGPVSVSYVFHHTESSTSGATASSSGSQDEHGLFLGLDFSVVKILGSYQMSDWGGTPSGGGVAGKGSYGDLWGIGAIVPVGKGNIHFNTYYMDLNGNTRVSGSAKGSGSSHTLAYTHGLSKRTTLYTALNYTDLSLGALTPSYTGSSAASGGAATIANVGHSTGGGDGITFGLGINHAF